MNTNKLYRKLIILSVCLFIAWIITTFPLIIMWYAKGEGHGFSHDSADAWRMFIFDIIPGLTSGYLVFGLILLDNTLKSKKSDKASQTA
jgi:hypothetical protein